ncbi:MAG: LptF/LptG family permease, partial [Epsilonproteobacteria bacterium]|nr:LptF/LptG family permease [Campylobacterota bacterium]
MAKSKRYILDIFANRFFTYFIPFFIIISMVFIIRLSVLSSKINLTFMELSTLFYYSLPEIFFFTIPLVFIASLITTLSKLSESNEIIALFTLGIRP